MQLKCKINNQIFENKLVQGITFSEEYSEVLDSATIIVDQVSQLKIKPYDDVYIYDGDFNGFNENGEIIGNCTFFKHFLINQFSEEILILNTNELEDNTNNGNIYKYKIELFSETKGLETVQLPNISITQPLNVNKKVSIYSYLQQYIKMYSPKIKVVKNDLEWEYKLKYKLDENLKNIFNDSYTPDFTLNSPNLRDVLSKLMITKDMIPYVENNVIKALDITKRIKEFDLTKGEIGYIYGSLSSSNYAENLKTNYVNALSQEKSCRMIEYLGFRNSDTALMKIEDLRLETRFPIYKINKIYMCYYKKVEIISFNDDEYKTNREQKAFLCKQDITPLVKLNSERNLLSKNFDEMENDNPPKNIKELSQYYMATVGYDIGSNYITGWGNKYDFLTEKDLSWFSNKKTYIENIIDNVDQFSPFGIYDTGYFNLQNQGISVNNSLFPETDNIYTYTDTSKVSLLTPFSNYSLALKGFFFIVEYDGFYNGTVITTKDGAESDITINDNQSNSLPLLEHDGLAQKEKINRFGNKAYTIAVRYKNINDLQPLGSYFSKDDVVIYHREYSINDSVINCTYYGMKDYVLKNYFTSVYAKHRPYNLMSYGESISRAENKKMFLLLSKNKQIFEYKKNNIFNNTWLNFNGKIFSCFKWLETENVPSIKHFKYPDRINYSYFKINSQDFASDLNVFVHGNSLCFNSRMYDNVSMGVNISKPEPFKNQNKYTYDWLFEPDSSYTGTLQSWYMTVDDVETGFLKEIGFYICHVEQDKVFGDTLENFKVLDDLENESEETLKRYYKQLFSLPLVNFYENPDSYVKTNVIGEIIEINKDNKEIIDMTYQLEPITMDDNILFSPWMMKLSDLLSNYNKFDKEFMVTSYTPITFVGCAFVFDTFGYVWTEIEFVYGPNGEVISSYPKTHIRDTPYINFYIDEKEFIKFKNDFANYEMKSTKIDFGKSAYYYRVNQKDQVIGLKMDFYKIESITENEIVFKVLQEAIIDKQSLGVDPDYDNSETISKDYSFTLKRIQKDQYNDVPDGMMRFSNIKIIKDSNFNGERIQQLTFLEDVGWGNFTLLLSSVQKEKLKFIEKDKIDLGYPQTMFVIESPEYLKKELVYDEYAHELSNGKQIPDDFLNLIKLSRPFERYFHKGCVTNDYIEIDLRETSSFCKSIQYWYVDGIEVEDEGENEYKINYDKASYKFVFGVNLTEEDKQKDKLKIYISALSSMNKKVYDQNYNLIGEMKNIVDYEDKTLSKGNDTVKVNTYIDEHEQTVEVSVPYKFFQKKMEENYLVIDGNGLPAEFILYADDVLTTVKGKYIPYIDENTKQIKLVASSENKEKLPISEIIFTTVVDDYFTAVVDISKLNYVVKFFEFDEVAYAWQNLPGDYIRYE